MTPLVQRLIAGESFALVSDAGSVGISNPGEMLVAAALAAGVEVEVAPGASAAIAALQILGLPTARFAFFGFLPRKGEERRTALAELAASATTSIIYESPRRLGETLAELAERLGPRRAVVARELTKLHEEVARGTLAELAQRFSGEVLGEVVVVIEGATKEARLAPTSPTSMPPSHAALSEKLGARALAKEVAEELGLWARGTCTRGSWGRAPRVPADNLPWRRTPCRRSAHPGFDPCGGERTPQGVGLSRGIQQCAGTARLSLFLDQSVSPRAKPRGPPR